MATPALAPAQAPALAPAQAPRPPTSEEFAIYVAFLRSQQLRGAAIDGLERDNKNAARMILAVETVFQDLELSPLLAQRKTRNRTCEAVVHAALTARHLAILPKRNKFDNNDGTSGTSGTSEASCAVSASTCAVSCAVNGSRCESLVRIQLDNREFLVGAGPCSDFVLRLFAFSNFHARVLHNDDPIETLEREYREARRIVHRLIHS